MLPRALLVQSGSCLGALLGECRAFCPFAALWRAQVWDNVAIEDLNKVLRPTLLKPVVPSKAARESAEALVNYTLRKSTDLTHQDNTTVLIVAFQD